MRRFVLLIFLFSLLASASFVLAQQATTASADEDQTAVCSFDSDREVSVQYGKVPLDPKKQKIWGGTVPEGKPWGPGGRAMAMFSNGPIQVGGQLLPAGAYTMFLVASEKKMTLIVSKQGFVNASYNPEQDLVRASLEFAVLPSPEPQLKLTFAHISPNECDLRVDIYKSRGSIVFQRK